MTSTAAHLSLTEGGTTRASSLSASRASRNDSQVRLTVDATAVGPLAVLPIDVRASLKTPRLCEDTFAFLAAEHPDALLLLIERAEMLPADLTFAAELAGTLPTSTRLENALLALLDHHSPVVREGAVYGLAQHVTAAVRERLACVVRDDPSPGVRAAATELLIRA